MNSIPSEKEYFDILLIVPLEDEVNEVMKVFSHVEDRTTSTRFRYAVGLPDSDLKILVIQQDEMGKSSAGRTTRDSLIEFDCGLIVLLGIAGSLSNDMRLGDVCYTGTVLDIYDNSKVSDKNGVMELEFSPTHYQTRRDITVAFNFVRTIPELQSSYEKWQAAQGSLAMELVPMLVPSRDGTSELYITQPRALNGTILCGAVSKSEIYNKRLRGLDRKVLAVETEAGAVFEEAKEYDRPALCIRGISDYADSSKSRLEDESAGGVRTLAAANAASFLQLQLTNPRFLSLLNSFRSSRADIASLADAPKSLPQNDIATVIRKVGSIVDEKLRELSPEFRVQPRGYQLPIPRVREFVNSKINEPTRPAPLEIIDAIRTRDFVVVNIPRNYPDKSLAWVIADSLLLEEMNNQQILPCVILGEEFKPPKSGLSAAFNELVGALDPAANVQKVFILDNFQFDSKTRLAFLFSEIEQNAGTKFIFLTRGELSLIRESEFATKISADLFKLGEVSFSEIAHFVQKNYTMSESESEVIALRLRETFHKYSLSAHPSYFAGISREMLSALLEAQRRVELIETAVNGFLTFVVAEDKSPVRLSRTTRLKFLQALAVTLKVEQISLTHEGLISFTKEFASKFDYEIDPLQFINLFVEKGILHFENDHVQFSLAFIESYLLAKELRDNDELALRYFQLGVPDFDLPAFDFYAELGPSNGFVAKLIERLRLHKTELANSSEHVLLTNDIRPAFLARKSKRLAVLEKRLQKAREDIRANRGDTKEKQEILDVTDRIRERAGQRATAIETSLRQADGNDSIVNSAFHTWMIAVVALGSGAEHLEADIKQTLVTHLIELTALITDKWTRIFSAVDFTTIRTELTSDNAIAELSKVRKIEDVGKFKQLIEDLVDVLEHAFLSVPFRRMMGELCEHARERVLVSSIEKAQVGGKLEALIHGGWLSDIDSRRGDKILTNAIKELPAAPFLRIHMATHLIVRAYWSIPDKNDRMRLLDTAADIIKPLNTGFDKSKLKRFIDNDHRSEFRDEDER